MIKSQITEKTCRNESRYPMLMTHPIYGGVFLITHQPHDFPKSFAGIALQPGEWENCRMSERATWMDLVPFYGSITLWSE